VQTLTQPAPASLDVKSKNEKSIGRYSLVGDFDWKGLTPSPTRYEMYMADGSV
jgi:hypothetical protein